jgi:glycosyltransferase involved in cell wall biosynthesis
MGASKSSTGCPKRPTNPEMRNLGRCGRLRVGVVAYGLDHPGSGIGRYAIEIVRALRASQPTIDVVLIKPFEEPIAGLDREDPVIRLPGTRRLPGMMAFGPGAIAVVARRFALDVVHDPTGVAPFLVPRRWARFARVATIHDMVPFVHPETHERLTNLLFRHYIPHTLPFVDRIITDSNASERDIVRFFRVRPDGVATIPCGVSPRFGPRSASQVFAALSRYGIVPPYLLTVGALQPRKNLVTLLEAFARLRLEGLPHRLIIVGSKAWKSESVFGRLDDLGLGDAVVFTGYVEDSDLPALYAGAACFVFPSIYEGFGLPPLEAMACGAPVVTSNASSLPEVVGDAAITVDPHDVGGFVAAIRRIVDLPALADELRARGLERSQLFTWERAAAAHADLYHDVVEQRRSVLGWR